jgi:DNA-binding NtrC family response regulator
MTNKKIFIVDDDKFYVNILEEKLNSIGSYSIEKFYTGNSCLDKACKQPDIIFLDQNLGDTTGIEVLRKIKLLYPLIQIVIISGQKEAKIAISSLRFGAIEYLIKNIEDNKNHLNKIINDCYKIVMI